MKKTSKPEVVNMNVRIPREVRTAAKIAAAKRGQNLNAYVAEVLAKAAALSLLLLVGCSAPAPTSDAGADASPQCWEDAYSSVPHSDVYCSPTLPRAWYCMPGYAVGSDCAPSGKGTIWCCP